MDGRRVPPPTLRRVAGYVLQDAVLPGTQTVWEYLMFHARLRLPASVSERDRRRRVRAALRLLLLEKVRRSRRRSGRLAERCARRRGGG